MSTPRTDKDFTQARLAYKRLAMKAWRARNPAPPRMQRDETAAGLGCAVGWTLSLLAAALSLLASISLMLGDAR